ncbi:MAG: hypothetical protein ACXVCG_15385 [Bdellovibrionota bacterium]
MKQILFPLFAFSLPLSAHAGAKIDLQWSVCDASPEAVLAKIGQEDATVEPSFGRSDSSASPNKEKDGRITYFDNSRPAFLQDGVTFRIKGEEGAEESSVKIRFTSERDVPEASCEWDRYGKEERYTCEVTGDVKNSVIWTKAQEDFLGARYRDSDLSKLKPFGPYDNRKWKFKKGDNKVAFDTLDTREAGHLMEFSVKVAYADRDEVYKDFSHWLEKHEVILCEKQESKTARLFRALGLIH